MHNCFRINYHYVCYPGHIYSLIWQPRKNMKQLCLMVWFVILCCQCERPDQHCSARTWLCFTADGRNTTNLILRWPSGMQLYSRSGAVPFCWMTSKKWLPTKISSRNYEIHVAICELATVSFEPWVCDNRMNFWFLVTPKGVKQSINIRVNFCFYWGSPCKNYALWSCALLLNLIWILKWNTGIWPKDQCHFFSNEKLINQMSL